MSKKKYPNPSRPSDETRAQPSSTRAGYDRDCNCWWLALGTAEFGLVYSQPIWTPFSFPTSPLKNALRKHLKAAKATSVYQKGRTLESIESTRVGSLNLLMMTFGVPLGWTFAAQISRRLATDCHTWVSAKWCKMYQNVWTRVIRID